MPSRKRGRPCKSSPAPALQKTTQESLSMHPETETVESMNHPAARTADESPESDTQRSRNNDTRSREEEHRPGRDQSVKLPSPSASPVSSIDSVLLDEEELPSEVAPESGADGAAGIPVPGTPTSPEFAPGIYRGGYNSLKSFKGQVYSGMAIGGSHTWNYDQGVWRETKKEPDLWEIDFHTAKRRARKAPRGSGAPVGTEYHWLIVAHQHVKKVDANTYETRLKGSKYKLAHKSSSSNAWSIPSVKAQREREIELLEDAKRRIQDLPPVLPSEKVKVESREKGQQKLDALFAKAKGSNGSRTGNRKRKVQE